VEWWKRQGRIEHRTEDKKRPTLRRSSVEEFGRWYHARHDDRRARREAKLSATRAARRPPQPVGYVTTAEATVTTGLSTKTVLRRAKPLGALRIGRSWWISSDAVDQILRQLRAEKLQAEIDARSGSPSETPQRSSGAMTARCSAMSSRAPSRDGARHTTDPHLAVAPSKASPTGGARGAHRTPQGPDRGMTHQRQISAFIRGHPSRVIRDAVCRRTKAYGERKHRAARPLCNVTSSSRTGPVDPLRHLSPGGGAFSSELAEELTRKWFLSRPPGPGLVGRAASVPPS
jgi:hypothetical protein